jgi:hypothetical protein
MARTVIKGAPLRRIDLIVDETNEAARVRREMEKRFASDVKAKAAG